MKLQFLLLATILTAGSYAQKKDTTFLRRHFTRTPETEYFAVYIDTGQHIRKQLTEFTFNEFDSATYFNQLAELQPLQKQKIPSWFPKKWIALYRLKGKYYLYSPSDYGNHYRFEITDSTTIDYTMEGPEPSRLEKIYTASSNRLTIQRENKWWPKQVEIELIDTARGIAVFTYGFRKANKKSPSRLLVDANKVHFFPAVVNHGTSKTFEYEFDKINFEALLKKKKAKTVNKPKRTR